MLSYILYYYIIIAAEESKGKTDRQTGRQTFTPKIILYTTPKFSSSE